MTQYTKSLLKAYTILILPAAILVCAALFVWSCDGSQFECGSTESRRAGVPNSLGVTGPLAQQVEALQRRPHSRSSDRPALNPFPSSRGSSLYPSRAPSLTRLQESGDCCTFRLAVGASDSAAEFTRGIGRDSRDVAHVGCESVAKNRTPLDTLHGTGSEEKD
jgi:hypothetical protein